MTKEYKRSLHRARSPWATPPGSTCFCQQRLSILWDRLSVVPKIMVLLNYPLLKPPKQFPLTIWIPIHMEKPSCSQPTSNPTPIPKVRFLHFVRWGMMWQLWQSTCHLRSLRAKVVVKSQISPSFRACTFLWSTPRFIICWNLLLFNKKK